MVSEIWHIIKKKSNIYSRDLFQKLKYLEKSNFENAKKLIKFLINKSPRSIPNCLYLENCLTNIHNKYKEFNYMKVSFDENH